MRIGCRTCDSSWCTTTTIASIATAIAGPRSTTANTVGTSPATSVPTIGTNDARNTTTTIGMTNGTRSSAAPMPTPAALIAATVSCVRVYAPRLPQP